MQDQRNRSRGAAARRGAFGAGIVVGHIGLIALIAHSAFGNRAAAPDPVSVAFLQREEQPIQAPTLPAPALAQVQPMVSVPPDLNLPNETDSAIAVAAIEDKAPPPAASPQSTAATGLPAMSDVAYLRQPAPRYPPDAKRAREEGLVLLRVLVDEEGRVKQVEVYRSSGHPRLDQAACSAVINAIFKPYMDRGVAHAAFATIPVEFSLRGKSS
jgi:protein TonB